MRSAPTVPKDLEAAITKLAERHLSHVKLHVLSEPHQLDILVDVCFGKCMQWEVSDRPHSVSTKSRWLRTRFPKCDLDKTVIMFVWDDEARRLVRHRLFQKIASAPPQGSVLKVTLAEIAAAGPKEAYRVV